jgi:hypothetical protein
MAYALAVPVLLCLLSLAGLYLAGYVVHTGPTSKSTIIAGVSLVAFLFAIDEIPSSALRQDGGSWVFIGFFLIPLLTQAVIALIFKR